ncbi:MAG: nucleotidyltransferase domain-containing protein [Promethearchaeia archaeon]
MPKLCRIDIENRQEIYGKIKDFIQRLKIELSVDFVYLFGSFAKNEVHEGSDIDLLIVGEFNEPFLKRIEKVLDLTELPIQPLVYTNREFEEMVDARNPLIREILKTGEKY